MALSLPPQTKYIVGNEACERFSFYGMRSILTLYMTSVLLMSEKEAMEISHLFIALIYILPMLGAWIADRFLGRYHTILYVSIFYCIGHAVLALADLTGDIETKRIILFTGLFIIAVGAGGIKPCVSAFVGDQAEGLRDKALMTRIYAAFYWSINLGSFFSFLVVPWARQSLGYGWAFGIPGIFMAIATIIFWCGRRHYRHKKPTQPEFLPALATRLFLGRERACERYGADKVGKAVNTALSIATFIVLAPIVVLLARWAYNGAEQLALLSGLSATLSPFCGLICLLLFIAALALAGLRVAATLGSKGFFGVSGSMLYCRREELEARYSPTQRAEARNMFRVLIVFLMIIPFWSLYDQTMSSWVLQGDSMQAVHFSVFGHAWRFGAEEIQSFNPLLVMILVPLVTLLLYPRIGKWGSPLRRMGVGIVLAGVSYFAVAGIQMQLEGGAQLSILWQCLPYLILTTSEILVSTTGLEYAYTAAGKNMKSIVLSFWYLTSTLGNLLVMYLSSAVSDPCSTPTFLLYGCMAVVVGLIFLFVTTRRRFAAEPLPEDAPDSES